jgi:hypothetical protein
VTLLLGPCAVEMPETDRAQAHAATFPQSHKHRHGTIRVVRQTGERRERQLRLSPLERSRCPTVLNTSTSEPRALSSPSSSLSRKRNAPPRRSSQVRWRSSGGPPRCSPPPGGSSSSATHIRGTSRRDYDRGYHHTADSLLARGDGRLARRGDDYRPHLGGHQQRCRFVCRGDERRQRPWNRALSDRSRCETSSSSGRFRDHTETRPARHLGNDPAVLVTAVPDWRVGETFLLSRGRGQPQDLPPAILRLPARRAVRELAESCPSLTSGLSGAQVSAPHGIHLHTWHGAGRHPSTRDANVTDACSISVLPRRTVSRTTPRCW